MGEVIFHAGIHKTGTSSLQAFLHRTRGGLRRFGVDFYEGIYRPGNHVELYLAAMRAERETHFKRTHPEIAVDGAYRARVTERVHAFISRSTCERVLFSTEGLSFLRHPDEMERLRDLAMGRAVRIVIYVRERAAWLASYRRQLEKTRAALPERIGADSYAYTGPDSWLVDFDGRIGRFREAFGADNVTVLDYDAEMARLQNIVPSFLEALGIDRHFRVDIWEHLFLNTTRDPGDAAALSA